VAKDGSTAAMIEDAMPTPCRLNVHGAPEQQTPRRWPASRVQSIDSDVALDTGFDPLRLAVNCRR
jgi:hypothetical protein